MLKKLTRKKVLDALTSVTHPKTGKDIVTSGAIDDIAIEKGVIRITMLVDPEAVRIMDGVRVRCEDAVSKIPGVKSAQVVMTAHKAPGAKTAPQPAPKKAPGFGHGKKPPQTPTAIPGIKRILAVASGKGGVGKSTTSVNLAAAFSKLGWKVGVFDCDIYGPSVQRMLGDGEQAKMTKDQMIIPVDRHGMKAMSMGYLVPEGRATVWRGPMVIGAVQQLLNGVDWTANGDLDILVVDLPPGTGDAQLTLVQNVPLAGALIVSTPQDIALIDARKAYNMFEKTETPILGLIENMSMFICPHCGERSDIFGHGGAKDTAEEFKIPFLGEVPLHIDIRKNSDDGTPLVIAAPEGQHAKIYLDIAKNLMEKMPVSAE